MATLIAVQKARENMKKGKVVPAKQGTLDIGCGRSQGGDTNIVLAEEHPARGHTPHCCQRPGALGLLGECGR